MSTMSVSISRELQIGGLSILAITLLLLGYIWKYKENMASIDTVPQQTVTTQGETYNWATVKQHNTPADCWLVIDQNVYGLTPYLDQHPGGAKNITALCGQDASAAFNNIHSQFAKKILKKFKVGALQG